MKIQTKEHKISEHANTGTILESKGWRHVLKQAVQSDNTPTVLLDQEMLHTRIQDWLWTGMDRTKAGCWVWSPAPSQHPERLPSSVLIHCEEEEEEKEEEAGGHPDVCCYTSGKFE